MYYTEDEFRERGALYLQKHPELQERVDLFNARHADAEEAKSKGGMVAFRLRTSDAQKIAIPGGEPVEDLHITMLYMGEDVGAGPPPAEIYDACDYVAQNFPVFFPRIFARAEFNPDTEDVCGVYLVSDSTQLDEMRDMLLVELNGTTLEVPEQHAPYIPHVTMGYGLDIDYLNFVGEICIDRISLNWASNLFEFPLI